MFEYLGSEPSFTVGGLTPLAPKPIARVLGTSPDKLYG